MSAQSGSLSSPAPGDELAIDKEHRWKKMFQDLVRAKTALFGSMFLVLLIFVAATAPLIAPHDPLKVDV
ncbi:MAG: ABC transporter permease, partial [Nitrospinaceae bacterium]|nr:ABC transporter permease [Nitrospinaceae bacterium]